MNLDALFLSLGISAAITATQAALQYAITKKDLPSRVDVSYPDPPTRIWFDTEHVYGVPIRMTCEYCRSTHDYIASNCRNCGAPL